MLIKGCSKVICLQLAVEFPYFLDVCQKYQNENWHGTLQQWIQQHNCADVARRISKLLWTLWSYCFLHLSFVLLWKCGTLSACLHDLTLTSQKGYTHPEIRPSVFLFDPDTDRGQLTGPMRSDLKGLTRIGKNILSSWSVIQLIYVVYHYEPKHFMPTYNRDELQRLFPIRTLFCRKTVQ